MNAALSRLLRCVRQPGRYTGGEFNLPAQAEPPAVVLAFPDLYEIGMSHWGTQILFWECVQQGIPVDRAFLPAPDLALRLRAAKLPLASLTAGRPLREVPLLGITIQHELAATAVLELLDLGGIPLKRGERGANDPLVIAGGPGIANPAPLSPFIDAFVPGDGEGFFAECRAAGVLDNQRPRGDRLRDLAALPGVWVPGLTSGSVRARMLPDLDAAFHPATMLVPNFRIVQERAIVELARGCPNRCRFCQARTLYAPWRRRAPATVRKLAQGLVRSTGFDRLSLMTLNAAAYPEFNELLRGLHTDLQPLHCSVMLPSQHIAALDPAILPLLASGRKGGLTLAPEAATERLRRVIGKQLSDRQLIDLCTAAAAAGWRQVKLYFMYGLPTETPADIAAIPQLLRQLPRQLEYHLTLSPFVPKPHTPFQWCGLADPAYLTEQLRALRSALPRRVRVGAHDLNRTLLEAALARGGPETGELILAAWRAGARLDSWDEYFNFAHWQAAAAACGLNLGAACRPLPPAAPLPWSMLDYGADREQMQREYAAALAEGAP